MDYINRFPKQKEIRQQWVAFCGINEDVLNTATRLCSNHFHEDLKNKRGKAVVLSFNAVPSIRMKKKEKSKQSNSVLNEVHDSIIQKYIATDKENIHYNVSVTGNNE